MCPVIGSKNYMRVYMRVFQILAKAYLFNAFWLLLLVFFTFLCFFSVKDYNDINNVHYFGTKIGNDWWKGNSKNYHDIVHFEVSNEERLPIRF